MNGAVGIISNSAELRNTSTSAAEPPSNTDIGNAIRFTQQRGQNLRYSYTSDKWYVWNGSRWREDTSGEVVRLAKLTARVILKEAALVEDDNKRRELIQWQRQSESKGRLGAMIKLAQSEMPVSIEDFDADQYFLNCSNGTLDLRTGTLCPHRHEDLMTKIVPVAYDPDAKAPRWREFLGRIFDGRMEMIEFVQRAVGYSLTGDTGEQCLFILHGSGANGKSVFLEVLRAMLGDYSQQTPTETLLSRRSNGVPNDVARLRGARLVTAIESGEGRRLAENLVKQLTGGDTITARFLFKEFFEFKPVFKLFLAANHKPMVRGNDEGIWRRIKLVPFTVTIPQQERDQKLAAKLCEELPGILRWAVEGCLEWQSKGLNEPEEVRNATAAYRSEMDTLACFISDVCIEGARLKVRASELYTAYKQWCEQNGEYQMTQTAFGSKLTERGFDRKHDNKGTLRCGLALRANKDEAPHDGVLFNVGAPETPVVDEIWEYNY